MFPDVYRHVLGAAGVKQPLAGVIIGRLSIAAEPLAITLVIRQTGGSFALAGLVLGVYSIAASISLPVQGRIIDRIGQTRVILPATLVNVVGFVALILLAHDRAGAATLVAAGTVAGTGTLPTGATMRTLWVGLVPDIELRQAAFAIDAVALDIAWVVGPLIAATVIAIASPTAALSVCIGLTILGSAVFASSPASRHWRGTPAEHGRIGPLRSSGVWVLMGAAFGVGLAVGAAELSITAFASGHGVAELAGALIAVQALASIGGGLWYGVRAWSNSPGERLPLVTLVFAVCWIPLVAVPSIPAAFPLMALTGLTLAPAVSLIYLLLDSLAPAGTAAEATGWVLTAIVSGAALGNAVAGVAVSEVSPHAGLAVAVAGGLVAVAATWAGRANLSIEAVREQPFARVHSM
jgi:hypothetical protein